MTKRIIASGLTLALAAFGTAWARRSVDAAPVTGRFTYVDATSKVFMIETRTGKVTFKTDGRTVFLRMNTRVAFSDLRIGDTIRVTYSGTEPDRIAAHVETVDTVTAGSKTLNGRVTFVDVSGRRVTIDTTNGSTDFGTINTGDRVRILLARDPGTADRIDVLSDDVPDEAGISSNRPQMPTTGLSRRLLGLGLLAMTGTVVAIRARRPRTI